MLIFNKKGQLFLGERDGTRGHWQFPQGGVKRGTSPKSSVYREILEELGIKKKKLGKIRKCKATHSYNWKTPPSYAKGKWRGQRQTFWIVEFLGKDSDVDLEHHDQEFMRWKWCTPKQVRRWADAKRIKGYRKPLREFEEFWKGRGE